MIGIVRPVLRWFINRRGRDGFGESADDLAVLLLVMLLSAVATEFVGVHALFGAFFAGLMMPRDAHIERAFEHRIEPLTMTLLLPLFFAFTGLRTNVQLLNSAAMWRDAALILLVAVSGKAGASTIAARAMGLSWRDAGVLGVLMNTRGLVELVVLNIGLDLGILSPAAFSMLVLMALITTFATSPIVRDRCGPVSVTARPSRFAIMKCSNNGAIPHVDVSGCAVANSCHISCTGTSACAPIRIHAAPPGIHSVADGAAEPAPGLVAVGRGCGAARLERRPVCGRARTGTNIGLEIVLRKQHYLQACRARASCSTGDGIGVRSTTLRRSSAAQLAFAFAFDALLAWSRRDTYTFGFGPFPIIFSTNLFLWFKPDWFYLQFLMVAVGFAAKELIRGARMGEGPTSSTLHPSR